jgi:3-oxoadipate enol-lactonase
VMDKAGVARAHIVGLSMGGMVAMWLATHEPQRVDRLVLANTTPHIPLRDMWNSRIQTALADGLDTIAAPTMQRWLSEEFMAAQPLAAAALIDAMRRMSPAGYAGCCAALREADQRKSVSRIGASTLVVTGSDDLATTEAVAQGLADAIPGARLEIIAGAGHLSNVEQPDAFNRALLDFLR